MKTLKYKAYCVIEPDRRYGLNSFNFELFPSLPADIFSASELKKLTDATAVYSGRTTNSSPTIQVKWYLTCSVENMR